MSELQIFDDVRFDESITKEEFHTYQPRAAGALGRCDEIRIVLQHQDIYTAPYKSYLHIEGIVQKPSSETAAITYSLTNNPFAFLFEEIRYELNGVEVDKVRDPGITSTLKGYMSIQSRELKSLYTAGWGYTYTDATNSKFYCILPLRLLLGFAEDYKRVIINAKQELILLRSRSDANCYKATSNKLEIKLEKVVWKIPHVQVNDTVRLKMLKHLNEDRPIKMPFRRWELHELPALRKSKNDMWMVKTSTSLERPRYVIIAFHDNRKERHDMDMSLFDHCKIRNIKIYLNSESYPYDNMNLDIDSGNWSLAYKMYTDFYKSYYGKSASDPILSYGEYKNRMIFVFDVSHQNESVKSSAIDLKIELESTEAFKENVRAYCLILNDSIVEYRPLSNTVTRRV